MEGKPPDKQQALDQDCLTEVPANEAGSSTIVFVWGAICLLVWLGYKAGGHAAGIGLRDPDSCWVLAMGRYIFEHHMLPTADPFSYTLASQHQPYAVYQWLSELIYFCFYKLYKLKGLLLGHALLVSSTFVIAPLAIFMRMRAAMAPALIFVVLLLLSASFRFTVKSEIFSFSLLFVWLAILWEWRVRAEENSAMGSSKQNLLFVASLFVVMLFWSNLHITFIFGFIILTLLLLSEAVHCVLRREAVGLKLNPLILGLIAAFLASLINPIGWQLWSYVPFVFFSPTHQFVPEMQPLSLADFRTPGSQVFLFPFLALFASSLYLVVRRLQPAQVGQEGTSKAIRLTIFSPLIVGCAAVLALGARRAIPFAAILLLCDCAYLLKGMDKLDVKNSFADFENKLRQLFERKSVLIFSLIGLFSLHGAYSIIVKYPPSLPQSSDLMTVPAYAIEALAKKPLAGRVLNDVQYGDVLIWYLPGVVPVFIDTRFALYGGKLVKDYMTISTCAPGMEQLLQEYKFDWAFFPTDAPISKYLRTNNAWLEVYQDETASIFRHNPGPRLK